MLQKEEDYLTTSGNRPAQLDDGFFLNTAPGIGVNILLSLYSIGCANVHEAHLLLQFGPYNNFIVFTAARVPMMGPSQYTA